MSEYLGMCTFRLMKAEDFKFVLSSWLKSFRRSPWAGLIANNSYHSVMKQTVDQLSARGAQIVVAENRESPGQLLGFICFERTKVNIPVLHYIFVKDLFRKQGIGAALLEMAGITRGKGFIYTFRTNDFNKRFKDGTHAPGIARRKDLEPIYDHKQEKR